MSRKNLVILSIGVILLFIILGAGTYAYFNRKVEGNEESKTVEVKTFNRNIEITFNDTSNVSLINAYTGDEITKTFTVTNTGDVVTYYDIYFKNVVNSFENKEDLVYTLSGTNDSAVVIQTVVPSSDESIAKNIRIGINEVHSYTMKIKFLQTEEDQSLNMNKTFSTSINVVSSTLNSGEEIYKDGQLGYEIINDVISGEDEINYNTTAVDGVYYTNSTNDGTKIYFYRGSNLLNNNVVFAGYCWKILRTVENGGIRLVYNGIYENNTCSSSKIIDTSSPFNTRNNFNAYVGYMYGIASSNNYENEHSPSTSSAIKILLENWYSDNLESYNDKIDSSAIYCNNRKTAKFNIKNVTYGNLGYGNNNTGYLMMNNYTNNYSNVSYKCENDNDKFTVSDTAANDSLQKPIGLLTVEELYYAGYLRNVQNATNFLSTNNNYWTMTPAYYNGNIAYNFYVNNSTIKVSDVSVSYGIRPVITLKKNVSYSMGDGSLNNPYKIN